MRAIGLDVHRDFCEVAVVEHGEVTSAGRIETTPAALELFAGSLGPDDCVALEVTGNAWEIARLIEPHVERVLVVSPSDTGIRQARAKTDRLDARALAKLLASGSSASATSPGRPSAETSRVRANRPRGTRDGSANRGPRTPRHVGSFTSSPCGRRASASGEPGPLYGGLKLGSVARSARSLLPALVLKLQVLDRDGVGVGVQVRQRLVLGDPAGEHPVGEVKLAGLVVDL